MAHSPRILVIQTAFLGDVVLTTPLFRGLKRLFPDAHLTALVTPAASPLLEGDPHLDALWTYDKRRGETLLSMAQRIRAGRFDRLICPHRSHRTALLALLSGIPERIGFRDAGFARAYGRRVDRPLSAHEVDRNLALLRGLGREPLPEDRVLAVEYSADERAAVEELVARAGFSPSER
ncbi:MAG: glycosyltransferase family 9 protein, partial [Deltaproteobacteria bacterium]|nr:glycosyltransferase family 9 protein [Deltaproteobacteria bacterium]